jgi:hypothetical protein
MKNETIFTCDLCNSEFDDDCDLTEVNGEMVCDDCLNASFSFCDDCEQWVDNNSVSFLRHYERCVCDDCLTDHYYCCEHCMDYITDNDVVNTNDGTICYHCYENDYGCCGHCGEIYHYDDLMYSDYHDEHFCRSCYRDSQAIHDYGYKPMPNFHGQGNLHFGVELEVEGGDRDTCNDKAEDIQSRNDDLWYVKDDGSLDEGMEIVSHPFTWKAYRKEIKKRYDDLLTDLSGNGFTSYNANTCGIHIHLSRKAFSTMHLLKFLSFYYNNLEFLQVISQRTPSSSRGGCQWSASKESESSELNYLIDKAKGTSCGDRYTAVNLENHSTVEVRIFRGTLNKGSFHKNIEFCKATFEYTRQAGLSETRNTDNFLDFVLRNRKTYSNLYEFLVRKGQIGVPVVNPNPYRQAA